MKCIIIGCKAKYIGDGVISFHKIYQNGAFNEEWVEAIRRYNNQDIDRSTKHSKICSSHFERKLVRNLGCQIRLAANAVPTIFPIAENITAVENSSSSNVTVVPNTLTEPSTPRSSAQKRKRTLTRRPQLDDSNEETTPLTLKCTVVRLKSRLVQKSRALKSTQRQLQRQRKQIGNLTGLISELRNQIMISENAAQTINNRKTNRRGHGSETNETK